MFMKAVTACSEIRVTNSTLYSTKESGKKYIWNELFSISNPQMLYITRAIHYLFACLLAGEYVKDREK